MPVKEAILGLVIERRGYGYAIKQRFEERLSVADFSESIVYSSLGSLVRDGYVKETLTSADAKGKRKSLRNASFCETPAGVRHYETWMAGALPLDAIRDEIRMRLAVCQPVHTPRMLELVAAHEQLCVDRIAELKRLQEGRPPAAQMTFAQAIEAALDEAEAMELQAKIEWLQKLRPTLKRFARTADAGGRGGLRGV